MQQSINIELPHKMAGLSAFCAENSFPEMIIWDGKTTSDFVKKESNSLHQSLNIWARCKISDG